MSKSARTVSLSGATRVPEGRLSRRKENIWDALMAANLVLVHDDNEQCTIAVAATWKRVLV